MSHIFISYSRNELDFARYIRANLEAAGFAVWMDEKRISAGMDWWGEIESNIDACAAFVVIMSPDSRDSVYVQNEILRALDQKKALFPILLSGKAFSILASVQYEDMRGGLNAKVSSQFIKNLSQFADTGQARKIRFDIVHSPAEGFECDAIALKYAKGFHGADSVIGRHLVGAKALDVDDFKELQEVGEYLFYETNGAIKPKHALFVRTNWVSQFGYRQIREFSVQALQSLMREIPSAKHIAMTIHGVNSHLQLDEGESLLAQVAGIVDAMQARQFPPSLERISIVELKQERVERLQKAVSSFFDGVDYAQVAAGDTWAYDLEFSPQEKVESPNAGREIEKPYALVLFPQTDELEDIFYYGIQRPIHGTGLLCERAGAENAEDLNQEATTILERIGQARALVCDVSEISPMLYLQIGYALGKGIPTALISRKDNPDFEDIIAYQKIWELEERLAQWLYLHF